MRTGRLKEEELWALYTTSLCKQGADEMSEQAGQKKRICGPFTQCRCVNGEQMIFANRPATRRGCVGLSHRTGLRKEDDLVRLSHNIVANIKQMLEAMFGSIPR